MLRQIKQEDIEKLVEIIPDFITETYPKEEFTRKDIRAFVQNVLDADDRDMIIYLEDDAILGFISFNITVNSFNSNKMSITEDGIYVRPDKRNSGVFAKLMKAFELMAQKTGISRTLIGCPYNKDFPMYEKLYGKLGYQLFEAIFIKEIKNEKIS